MKLSYFYLIPTTFILAASPAYSASLSFVPVGLPITQLDSDALLDVKTSVGSPIAFTVKLDTTGLSAPLKSLQYQVIRDPSELNLQGFTRSNEDVLFFPQEFLTVDIRSIDNEDVATIGRTSIATGLPVGTILDLETVFYTVGSNLINDGLSDRRIILTSAIDINDHDVTALFEVPINQPSTNIDLQPIPEPLTLLGVGTVIGFGAAFKRKLKLNQ